MAAKFPRRRADGSFRVIVRFTFKADDPRDLESRVAAWLHDWVLKNREWTRSPAGQPLDFFDTFAREPYNVVCDRDHLSFRLESPPGPIAEKTTDMAGAWWRDWLARLIPDLRGAFPEI